MVFRLDPKAVGKNDAVVEVLDSPPESRVKFDDEVVFEGPKGSSNVDSKEPKKRPEQETMVTQQHGDHVDEIRFVRRRYGHKKVVIHKDVDKKVTKNDTRGRQKPIFKRSVLNDTVEEKEGGSEKTLPSENYMEKEYGENEEVSMGCVKSNLNMVAKRWEYMSGQSKVVSRNGHDNLTDIDAACEAMWQSCLNDNPNLVLGLVGPQASAVREFCGSVSQYHDWTQKRNNYIQNFASKYNDKCALTILQDTVHAPEQKLFPGPYNWAVAGTQLIVIVALIVAIIQRFLQRD